MFLHIRPLDHGHRAHFDGHGLVDRSQQLGDISCWYFLRAPGVGSESVRVWRKTLQISRGIGAMNRLVRLVAAVGPTAKDTWP